MIKVVSWNIAKMHQPWRELLEMNADVALLQEVGTVPDDVRSKVAVSPQEPWEPWPKEHYDRWPIAVKLSDRVKVDWFRQVLPTTPRENLDELAVSCGGIIAAAKITPLESGEPFIAVSMYARWFSPHPTTEGDWIYPDAAAHHIISDLTTFIGYYDYPAAHRILATGDLNMSFRSSDQFNHRAQTIYDRMGALGLEYMGPEFPNGRQADPIPEHPTEHSKDVPTYYHKPTNSPAGARVQIDHVFASRGFHNQVRALALNRVDEWGSSDHCRILIEVGNEVANPD